MAVEVSAQSARSRALAVLRVRSRALALALLPAAVAVVLLTGGATGHMSGRGWDALRWIVTLPAVVVLVAAAGVAVVIARSRPAVSPTVPVQEASAPDLYRMVRDLADRLDVPAPSAIALTPDCDSWLEDRTHPAHGPPTAEGTAGTRGVIRVIRVIRGVIRGLIRGVVTVPARSRRGTAAPVLVIGSPFLWWMRVGELRAVLAPVVAGTGPSAHPDIAAARRFVRGLDAAVAVTSVPARGPLSRVVLAAVGWVARFLLRSCRAHAAEMERGVAAAAAERAQAVDYGLRIVAQEQVGLAYAGWDRLLTRVALPAWRMGRWPSRLDAGVVAALTELSRRDRLAEGFASRLGERPACDLLEEPGAVDEAASLLAARLFHGGPAEPGPDWTPVSWQEYPDEVVDRKWRTDAARLHRVMDALRPLPRTAPHAAAPHAVAPHSEGATLARVMDHLTVREPGASRGPTASAPTAGAASPVPAAPVPAYGPARRPASAPAPSTTRTADVDSAHVDSAHANSADAGRADAGGADAGTTDADTVDTPATTADAGRTPGGGGGFGRGEALAAGLSAELAREESASPDVRSAPADRSGSAGTGDALWEDGMLPLFPSQPPRTGRELLTDHVTAMVCCAAVDTAGAAPGLDWLDGPALMVGGERAADLTPLVLRLVEEGDPEPLRGWLVRLGVRPEKPVRLV
ncbi:hypothetical protein [Streptomyces jeddahensis]|uniref:Uncharacterized protein n=1 Tax=Streptomyces jeddahensis TaxID=1716141 RepID=A0A177HXE8_9ACTN|nr:hypothetical protein STSP_15990 [Streptomyces jeddahensis]